MSQSCADTLAGGTDVPLLSWLTRRFRATRQLEAAVEERERRNQETTTRAHLAADRMALDLERLRREMQR